MDTDKNLYNYLMEHAEFNFEALPEDISPVDMFSDPRDSQWIIDQLENGNDAAWFCAKVTASINGLTGTDYLGGCSYKSIDDFINDTDGYYPEMKAQAVRDLIQEIDNAREKHHQLNAMLCKAGA